MAEEMVDEMYDYEDLFEKVFEDLTEKDLRKLARMAKIPDADFEDDEDLKDALEEENLVSERDVSWLRKALSQMDKRKTEQIVYRYEMFHSLGKVAEILENLKKSDLLKIAKHARLSEDILEDVEDGETLLIALADGGKVVTRNITWIIFALRSLKSINSSSVLPSLLKYQGKIRLTSFTNSLSLYFSKNDAYQLAKKAKLSKQNADHIKARGMSGFVNNWKREGDNYLTRFGWLIGVVEAMPNLKGSAAALRAMKLYKAEHAKTRAAQAKVDEGMKRLSLD